MMFDSLSDEEVSVIAQEIAYRISRSDSLQSKIDGQLRKPSDGSKQKIDW